MTFLRVSEVASLLRVSDDTIRRWIDQGRLDVVQGEAGRKLIDGAQVASFLIHRRDGGEEGLPANVSARNQLEGIVTDVKREGLVAVVEIQAGPFRVVSMMTREAADELGLEIGSLATAVVKATTVIVETPRIGA
ncbi:MAG: Molybdate-binding domain of ModE [Cryobacterium sp.]|jgi:molybdopterin-binding protein|nr:Molybdate-binding domain of ModE [Cryobacterium sp.]